jgi:multidrug efflux pump subunit AcrA (membrane-fusion protein)
MGNATQNTIIPVNALLEDYGSYSVIVQLSGESFERRAIKIGKRNGENVEILQGLKVGEVVVTTGSYQVKMASMSGSTPAHGH